MEAKAHPGLSRHRRRRRRRRRRRGRGLAGRTTPVFTTKFLSLTMEKQLSN
jgi:hypothetical protein